MRIEEILKANDRVYVDNCRLASLNPQDFSQEDRSKLVVTEKILKEYFDIKNRTEERDEFVKSLPVQTISSLEKTLRQKGIKRTWVIYPLANTTFTWLALETLKKDLRNGYHYKVNLLEESSKKEESRWTEAGYLLGIGAGLFGFAGVTHILNQTVPFKLGKKLAEKNYEKRLKKIKEREDPKSLLQSATKKRKRWIQKNLKTIANSLGRKNPDFDPIASYSYTDADLMTLAIIDSKLNDYKIGIWTRDTDFKKYFDFIRNQFTQQEEEKNLSLYLDLEGKEVSRERVSIPNLGELLSWGGNHLEKELEKEDPHFKALLSKTKPYGERFPYDKKNLSVDRIYGSFYSMMAIAGATTTIALGKMAYLLNSRGMLGNVLEAMCKSPFSGDFDLFRGSATIASLAVASPIVSYLSAKKAYNHIKRAIARPESVEKKDLVPSSF